MSKSVIISILFVLQELQYDLLYVLPDGHITIRPPLKQHVLSVNSAIDDQVVGGYAQYARLRSHQRNIPIRTELGMFRVGVVMQSVLFWVDGFKRVCSHGMNVHTSIAACEDSIFSPEKATAVSSLPPPLPSLSAPLPPPCEVVVIGVVVLTIVVLVVVVSIVVVVVLVVVVSIVVVVVAVVVVVVVSIVLVVVVVVVLLAIVVVVTAVRVVPSPPPPCCCWPSKKEGPTSARVSGLNVPLSPAYIQG